MNFSQVFRHVFTVEVGIAALVFVLVLTGFGIAVVRRRAGAGRAPSERSQRNALEWVYVVLLAGIAGFLVYFTASANAEDSHNLPPAALASASSTRVQVTGFQWCWQFHYVDQPITVTGDCTAHRYPVLVVPTGKPVTLQLTTRDVVHSFWIPDLDVKVDLYPDHTNNLTLNFDKPGQWFGRCAEFCGSYHTTMDFWVKAVSPAEYQRWTQQHRSTP